jgi:hypothetical protein
MGLLGNVLLSILTKEKVCGIIGAGEGIQTIDFNLGKVAVYR